MALKEYKPGTTFPGVIGRTAEVLKPAWPEPETTPCAFGRFGDGKGSSE